MKTAIVTGAFGFAGANLTEELISSGYKVYAVGRKSSLHNDRLSFPSDRLVKIFLDMEEYDRLPDCIAGEDKVDFFFHLAWGGNRNDEEAQARNIEGTMKALLAAHRINPDIRFVATGSQAEYGVVPPDVTITEKQPLLPITAYGRAKAEAFRRLSKEAEHLGLFFIWARLFSVIGKYEPEGRMFPDLINNLQQGREVKLSSCTQCWDYLDAIDAARALIALAIRGRNGEAYNIASSSPRILKDYVDEVIAELEEHSADGADDLAGLSCDGERKSLKRLVSFGPPPSPFISLRPSNEKLKADTGWQDTITIAQTVKQNYVI